MLGHSSNSPATLPYLKETFMEKIKYINKQLVFTMSKNSKLKQGGKRVEYEKIQEKINMLEEEQELVSKEYEMTREKM